ncbi:hypothetical protein JTB14_023904 [Gonioctena quinquepunctata]|nr:hypothetical protein JTB14_023904 [Gonioctena quinquepunctata]
METTVSVEDESKGSINNPQRKRVTQQRRASKRSPSPPRGRDPDGSRPRQSSDRVWSGNGEPGRNRKSWQLQTNRGTGGLDFRNGGLFPLLLQAPETSAIQHGRASTALICRKLRKLDINISLTKAR